MREFHDRMLVDGAGDDIGKIVDVISDPIDLHPEWLVVKLGRLAGEHLVPVAAVDERDDRLALTAGKDAVKSAPRLKEHLAPSDVEREAVYRHYGLTESGTS